MVRGELEWWTMRARREYLRLLFWGKISRGEKGGLVENVYKEGRKRLDEGKAGEGEWCKETQLILVKYGLGEYWRGASTVSGKEWAAMVRGMVVERENIEWRWGMLQGGQRVQGHRLVKTKLLLYLRLKDRMKKEWWLGENRVWVRRWVMLRADAVRLAVEKGRWNSIPRIHRICRMCSAGVVEDIEHCIDGCEKWKVERDLLWKSVGEEDKRVANRAIWWSGTERLEWLLKGEGRAGWNALRGVVEMVKKREAAEGTTVVRR